MPPVMAAAQHPAAARSGGLRGLWAWVRRTILRTDPPPRQAGRPAAPARPGPATPFDTVEAEAPVEPRGTRVRQAPTRTPPSGAALLSTIQEGLAAVPPLPHVVRELLRELSDPASNARSVARIAASDPALAASLIRTVNSAAFALRRKVTSVTEAISYLGYTVVRSLVIRMRLEQMLPAKGEQAAYDAEDLWIHSLAVSHAAECLAERVPGVDRGFVSTLGLLHDIGKLAINSQFPSSAAALREANPEHADESFLDREKRVLGADHAEIGAFLARHWKLPHDIIEAIRWHHAPQGMPEDLPAGVRAATGVVHLANQLAKYCYVYSENMEIDIVSEDLFRQLGIPGPLPRLLNSRVRSALSRAIFYADESSTRPLGAIRRFLKLCDPEQARHLIAHPRSRSRTEPRIRVYEEMHESIFDDGCPLVDLSGRRPFSTVELGWKSATRVRFLGKTNGAGTAGLLASVTQHQAALPLDEDVRLPARFLVRRLLPAIGEAARGEPGTLEIAQALMGGRLVLGIRTGFLAFDRRFGEGVSPRAALGVVEEELANVLNLRWFSEIRTDPEGSTLIFISHPNRR